MRNIQRCQSSSEILVRWYCPQCGIELKAHIDVLGGTTILDKPHIGFMSTKRCSLQIFEVTYHQDVTVEAILPVMALS